MGGPFKLHRGNLSIRRLAMDLQTSGLPECRVNVAVTVHCERAISIEEESGLGPVRRNSFEAFQIRPRKASFEVNVQPMVAHRTDQGEFTVWAYFPGSFSVGFCEIHLPFAVNSDAGTRMSQSGACDGECQQRHDNDCWFCFHGCDFGSGRALSAA